MHLGDGAELELAILAKASAVEELAGAVSLGEIGCTQLDGYPMFHNATLVCTARAAHDAPCTGRWWRGRRGSKCGAREACAANGT